MKYSTFRKSERIILYALAFAVCFLLVLIFYRTFIEINEKGFEVFETFIEWMVYVFSMVILCGFLLSLANSFHEILEDKIVLRFGVFGFVHIKYSQIEEIGKFEEKNIPFLGMRFSDGVYYGYFGRKDLVRVKLKGEAEFYYLFLKKRKVNEIIFSVSKRDEFLEEIKKRQEKC
ncbi:hypothetical protein [Caldanaerobacter subterraneus]|uniref:Bacterial Pleckstrin homology domain-containing protein n=1 Tax=Caldanaerobacter subterraneus TaxID=911092 RepID=A0A7Y2L616_9THEO|nr:hypothetical protein [Caldanaerobacter subterraneus]NNG65872.1 hypothetical protein [Caldanaerobacter subterraneus]